MLGLRTSRLTVVAYAAICAADRGYRFAGVKVSFPYPKSQVVSQKQGNYPSEKINVNTHTSQDTYIFIYMGPAAERSITHVSHTYLTRKLCIYPSSPPRFSRAVLSMRAA